MTELMRPALVLFITLSVLTGLGYPVLVTALGQTLFPAKANGSLVRDGERVVGSTWIGQFHSDPRYFWSRPSATGGVAYDAAASSGSNVGPSNPALHEAVQGRVAALRSAGGAPGTVPGDLVTASGSGLDPHISPASARYQVARVARTRGLSEAAVRERVDAHVEGRSFGLLGEARVNVLLLNLDLDRNEGGSRGE